MIVIGILSSVFAIAFLGWLLFTLAVYALPFSGMTAAFAAYHSGAGFIGALIVGVFAGAGTLVIGQIAFTLVRSPLVRAVIALVYAVPAAIAGYHATLGLARIGVPSPVWQEVFAVIGTAVIGGTSFARMSFYNPMFAEEPIAEGPAQP